MLFRIIAALFVALATIFVSAIYLMNAYASKDPFVYGVAILMIIAGIWLSIRCFTEKT